MEKLRSTFSFMQGNVLVLTVSHVLWGVPLSIVDTYLPLFILSLGGSPKEVGVINALGAVARLILSPVGGYIADHKGRVKLVGIVTYCLSLSFIFHIVAQHWTTLAIGHFLRFMLIFYGSAMSTIMADSLSPSHRGVGFATANAIPGAVTIVAPYIGGYLIFLFGKGSVGVKSTMRVSYIATLIVGLLVATIRIKFLKETLTVTKSSSSTKNVLQLLKESYVSVWKSLKWMSRTLWSIAIIQISITLSISIVAPFWVIYAINVIGLTEFEWGIAVLISGILRVALSIPMGYFADRYGSKKIILIAMLLGPLIALMFIFCNSFVEVLFTLILIALANAIMWPAFSRLVANIIPLQRRGRLLSMLGQSVTITFGEVMPGGFLLFIPMAFGSLIGGYLYASNPKYPWFFLTSAFIPCLILSFLFIHEPQEAEL